MAPRDSGHLFWPIFRGVDGATILLGNDLGQRVTQKNKQHKEEYAPVGSRMRVRSELMTQPVF